MNFIKYFTFPKYEENKCDCWFLVCEIFKDEHNLILPSHPIMISDKDSATYLKSNIDYSIVDKAQKGCIVYYTLGDIHHAGYALDDKKFIHNTKKGVRVDKIPQNATIYKVLND